MIIITGGAGFIGSNLVAALDERGIEELVVCDSLGVEDKWRNLAKRDLYGFVAPSQLMQYLEEHKSRISICFHLGAISTTTERDADLVMRNNFQLSMDLFKWCSINRVRFIYASSAATYGSGQQGFEDNPQREALAQLRPLNVYGWSKHVFDRALAQIRAQENKAYPMPPQCVGLKFFNVYGPNEYHKGEQMSVVAHLFHQIQAKKSAQLFKSDHPDYQDGGQLRDFIFINDCVDVMLWLYDHPDVSGLYNVGTGKARSFADLAHAVYAAMGIKPAIVYKDMPAELKGKYQYFTQAKMENLRKAGYTKPFTSLEEGIRTYVQQFLMAKDPYC